MEEKMKLEQVVSLIGDLKEGKELAKQLSHHLASSPSSPSSPPPSSSSSSSHEAKEVIIEKILSIYEKALTMLNSNMEETKANNNNNMLMDISNCSSLANGSPKSEVLDQEVTIKHKDHVFKKRKSCMPRWTKQVKVCSGTPTDASMDDGFSWRKYGQKDILGAKYPRGYYRCTHRNVQGCLATKQVQKSDEDPTLHEITYKGRHTCIQANNNNNHLHKKTTTTTLIPSKPKSQIHHQKNQSPPQEEAEEIVQQQQQPSQETTMFTFGASLELEVKIEDLGTKEVDDIFPSFCDINNNMYCETMIDENNFVMDQCFSPQFMSPTTSETNIFCQLGENNGLGLNVQTSDFDFTEMISTPTTLVTNSPIIDLDFLFDKVDFDVEFPV